MIVFTLLGFAAGIKTVLRTARELNETPPHYDGIDTDDLSGKDQDLGDRRQQLKKAAASYSTRWTSSSSSRLFGDGPVHFLHRRRMPRSGWRWPWRPVSAALLVLGTRGRAVVPSRIQSIAELAYGFVYKMVEDVAGKDGVKYFPYIMTLFMFIVFANFLGLIPMSFTTTSHIAVTAVMALAVFFSVTIIGFYKHGHGLSEPVLDFRRAAGAQAHPRADRGHQLLRAARQPLHPSCGQHDGRSRGDQGFRGLCRRRSPSRRLSIIAITAIYALEVLVSFIPGLCLRDPHMRLPQRRPASASLTDRNRNNLKHREFHQRRIPNGR